MKLLFIGDVCGEAGVNFLADNIDDIKKKYKINVVVVNGENACEGKGINQKYYKDFMKMGVNVITLGNHAFSNKEIDKLLEDKANIVVPANYPTYKDKGFITIKYNNETITVINVLGRVYMNLPLDCPFRTVKSIIDEVKSDYYIVDVHAEATSEKIALGYYLDGIKGAILGTHTHVPTCDETILDKGTFYITDVGMTGPLDGVIGVDKELIQTRFLEGRPTRTYMATGRMQLNGVVVDFDLNKITRINIKQS